MTAKPKYFRTKIWALIITYKLISKIHRFLFLDRKFESSIVILSWLLMPMWLTKQPEQVGELNCIQTRSDICVQCDENNNVDIKLVQSDGQDLLA